MLLSVAVGAQQAKKVELTGSVVGASAQALSKSQMEIVRKVSGYFNQVTGLQGSFTQTSADNKRERGKLYISRPGRFRFEFNRPSRVVIISDGKYIAIQDRDLNTDDRSVIWGSLHSAPCCRKMSICFGTRASSRSTKPQTPFR